MVFYGYQLSNFFGVPIPPFILSKVRPKICQKSRFWGGHYGGIKQKKKSNLIGEIFLWTLGKMLETAENPHPLRKGKKWKKYDFWGETDFFKTS